MLRTLGASRRQLVTSVILEAFVLGLLASALGLVLGIGFAPAINALFQALEIDLPNEGTVIAARTIILSLVLGTLLTVLASLIPALRVTRVPPVTGLREGAVLETEKSHRVRTVVAFVLTGVGIALMLLGVFGALSPGEAWVGRRRGRHLHRRRAAQPAAGAPDGLDRRPAAGALPRRVRAPGARELGPQPRPHRLHGRRAHDRAGAGLVRGHLRGGPAQLDQLRLRQDDPGRADPGQQRRLLGHLGRDRARGRAAWTGSRWPRRPASARPTWPGTRASTRRS